MGLAGFGKLIQNQALQPRLPFVVPTQAGATAEELASSVGLQSTQFSQKGVCQRQTEYNFCSLHLWLKRSLLKDRPQTERKENLN